MATNVYMEALKRQIDSTGTPKKDVYNTYSEAEYNKAMQPASASVYNPARDTSGKSVYDIQRERVSQQAATKQKELSDAISRRLAAQGISGGVENKNLRNIAVEMAKAEAQGLGDVGMSELTAAEQERQAQTQRDYATRERLGTQAYQSDMYNRDQGLQRESLYAGLSQQEEQQQRTLTENARQFDSQQAFQKWATEQGFSQENAKLAWQSQESEKARTFEGTQQDKQLAENARQFNTQQDFQKWATEQGWNQDAIQRAWQSTEAEKARVSTEKIAGAELSLREKELAQNASQFNTEAAFKKYATDRQYSDAESQRAWQSYQNSLQLAQTKELAKMEMTQREAELVVRSQEFASQQAFDRWAQQNNISQAEAQRAWQASQNEAERKQALQISQGAQALEKNAQFLELQKMQQQAQQFTSQQAYEKWATQAGLDQQTATRLWQAEQNAKEIASREKLAGNELSLEQARLAQNAQQFKDDVAFKKWAQSQGIDEAQAQRAWQASENDKARFFEQNINNSNLSLEDKKLAMQSRQFDTQQKFQEWATKEGYAQDEIQRSWEANQNALKLQADKALQTTLQKAEIEQKQYELAYGSQEAEKDRAFKENIEQSNLSIQEKQLAENARQFDSQQSFQTWATQQGWAQDEIQRSWQAKQNSEAIAADKVKTQMQLTENARQFDNEAAFKTWAEQNNVDQQEAQRAWQSSEQLKDRQLQERELAQQKTLTMADLSLREKQLAQDQSQFASEQAFQKYATDRGFTEQEAQRAWQSAENEKAKNFEATQADLVRKFTTGERLGAQDFDAAQSILDRAQQMELSKMDLSAREKELAQNASQFKDKIAYDKWALAQGFSENEKNRAWDASQSAIQLTAQNNMQIYQIQQQAKLQMDLAQKDLEKIDKTLQSNITLQQLQNDLSKGMLDYQALITQKQNTDKLMSDSYFAAGMAGKLTADEITALKTDNPLAYYAYKSGESGKDKATFDADIANRTKILDALMTSASELPSGAFKTELQKLATAFGMPTIEWDKLTNVNDAGTGLQTSSYAYEGLGKDIMSNKVPITDISFAGKDDTAYMQLLYDPAIPQATSSQVSDVDPRGSKNASYQISTLENSFANGTPFKYQSYDDPASMDIYTIDSEPINNGETGTDKREYTLTRAYDGQQFKLQTKEGGINYFVQV